MDKRELVLKYRTSRLLKGRRPACVYLKKNFGKIYNEGQADFIMTIGTESLHFQRLSFFFKNLKPEKDFSLKLNRIKSYHLREDNIITSCLTLYTFEKNYIEIFYNTKLADSYQTEDNIRDIIKMLEERGCQQLK